MYLIYCTFVYLIFTYTEELFTLYLFYCDLLERHSEIMVSLNIYPMNLKRSGKRATYKFRY